MEVVSDVEIEISNEGLREDLVAFELNSNGKEENELADSNTDSLPPTGVTAADVASESKASSIRKKNGSSKTGKIEGGLNGTRNNPRAGLSQSLSFPAKGYLAGALKKSTAIAKQMKGGTKNPANGSEVTNGGARVRQVIAERKSLPVKPGLVDHRAPFGPKSNNDNLKSLTPLKETPLAKNDDDGTSTTSSTTPRDGSHRKSTGSVFSFRLDERAEKRKEFFSKLEEKVHAKELEKNSIQAKSKESQEAEIKQLRKSLTFKATPMPIFYQEPGPPKVELKKIPPTRARSPKLGRHKPSTSEGSVSSPRANSVNSNGGATNSNGGSVALKKTTVKSLSKLPFQKATVAKPEAKSQSLKPKVSNLKQKPDKRKVSEPGVEDSVPETSTTMEAGSVEKAIEVAETIPNPSDSGTAPAEAIEVPNEEIEVPEKN